VNTDRRTTIDDNEKKRESGKPGGGQGRVDEVGRSGVYPMSGPLPEGDADVQPMASWGQGERSTAGYEDHGDSELHVEGTLGGDEDEEEKTPAAEVIGKKYARVWGGRWGWQRRLDRGCSILNGKR
jgi:hypothetical protein